MTGRLDTGWTDGADVAVCHECATPFAGMVCPNCRQRLEARDLPPYDGPDDCLGRLSDEAGPDLVAAAFGRREVA